MKLSWNDLKFDRVETFRETKRGKGSNPVGGKWLNESTFTSKPKAVVVLVVAVEKQDTCSVIAVAVTVVLVL